VRPGWAIANTDIEMTDGAATAKPLFCLVDPSLKDFIGHHYEYDRAVIEGAEADGYEVVTLAHKQVISEIASRLKLRPAFACDIWAVPPGVDGADRNAVEAACNEQFYADLCAAIADLSLDRRSVVFGHMVTSRQLAAWARFALEHGGEDGPTIVLLLRYQPEHYMGPLAEKAFAQLQAAAAHGRLRLSSDSSRLAGQLQRLTTLPVETWPLPHTTELHDTSSDAPWETAPLRVVSLGNARDEKGIVELLNAVRIVEAAGQAHRFEFVFQVNDANPDIAAAVAAFAAEPHPGTTLLFSSLSTDAYFDLLKSADVVALPYWRDVYVARTSGVFLEAVAGGKPVICTADTWMSDQLALAGAGVLVPDRDDCALAMALIEMAATYPELSKRARATQARWLQIHNPSSFMRALLHGEVAPAAASNRPSVAVLYPWGDALQNAAGAALRLSLFLRFLTERSGRVRLLEDGDHRDIARDGVSFEAVPFVQFMTGHRIYRWISRIARFGLGAKDGEEFYFALMLLPQFSRLFYRRINELVKNSDLIFLEYPFWAPLVARACKAHGKRFILTNYDVISDQVRVSKPLRWLTAQLERRAMRSASARVAVTESDQAKFRAWGLDSVISPNCVDADAAAHRLPVASLELLSALCGLPPGTRHLFVFVGSKFRPNELAAAEVRRLAQAFERRYPDLPAHFVVAGACHEPEREGMFSALGRVDDLTLKLLYENCTAVLIPLTLGTGLSLKTVEALAAGQVIVGSDVAFRGVPAGEQPGWIAENDFSRYPEILARLIADQPYRDALSRQAVVHGRALDFRSAFAAYLTLEPRLASVSPTIRVPAERYRAYLLDAAHAAQRLGHADTALALVDALIRSNPEAGEAYRIRADIRVSEGRLEAALADLGLALSNHDAPSDVLRARAEILKAMDRPQLAEETLGAEAAITLNALWLPETEGRLRAKLWAAFHTGERDWVHRICSGAIRLKGPSLPHEYLYLMALTSLDVGADLEAALEAARSALDRGYDRFWGLMLIGDICSRLERRQEAMEAFRQAAMVAGDESQRAAANNSAAQRLWPLFDAGDYEEVLTQTWEIIEHWPDHPVANYLRAEALKILGRELLEACDRYELALQSGFRPYFALSNLGQLKIALGDTMDGLARLIAGLSDSQTPGERDNLRATIRSAVPPAAEVWGRAPVERLLAGLPAADREDLLRDHEHARAAGEAAAVRVADPLV